MKELENYIKENSDSELVIGETNSGEFFIRPLEWGGVWQGFKLVSGSCLAYFSSREEAEKELKRFGYNGKSDIVDLLK